MKIYTLEKVNVSKLYLLITFGLIIYVLLLILFLTLLTLIFPKFEYVSLLILLTALIFGNIIYRFSFKKSSKNTQFKLNDKKITFEENEILLENVKNIKLKGTRFNYHPKIIFQLFDRKKIVLRISKNHDYEKLIFEIKSNLKLNPNRQPTRF